MIFVFCTIPEHTWRVFMMLNLFDQIGLRQFLRVFSRKKQYILNFQGTTKMLCIQGHFEKTTDFQIVSIKGFWCPKIMWFPKKTTIKFLAKTSCCILAGLWNLSKIYFRLNYVRMWETLITHFQGNLNRSCCNFY